VDGAPQLLGRVLREVPARPLAHNPLEGGGQPAQVFGVQVQARAGVGAGLVQRGVEQRAVHAEDGAPVHLHQQLVGVPGGPLLAVGLRQPLHGVVVQAQVEDGAHHP